MKPKFAEDMKSYKNLKAQKIHLTLTLGEVDALVAAGGRLLPQSVFAHAYPELESALQKLDEAVNG